jgi:NAD(P)-dependent dehydrogenase (short-subunit alcohol dehydrogenase family)
MIDLKGKVVLITGGANGLGADMATLCTGLGARIVIADIEGDAAQAMASQLGSQAIGVRCDIADSEEVNALAQAALDRFGRVDALVNNAALTNNASDLDLLSTDLAVWDRTMDVNLRGTLLVCRAILPLMLQQGDGAVINIVSRQGVAPPQSGRRVAYGVSKAAIIMLTRHIAVAYGKQGIRSNAVAPGTIRSEKMLAALSPERLAQSRKNVLTPDLGEPADISRMVAYLASDAGRYITGQTLQVDGGVLAYLHE